MNSLILEGFYLQQFLCVCVCVCVNASVSVKLSVCLPIMPLTVPKSTEPWVGVELSPRFCSTSEPWQKTFTNSPRWKTPTSCRCCRSSSVVAALTKERTAGEKYKEGGGLETLREGSNRKRSNYIKERKRCQRQNKIFWGARVID